MSMWQARVCDWQLQLPNKSSLMTGQPLQNSKTTNVYNKKYKNVSAVEAQLHCVQLGSANGACGMYYWARV